jgi:hypothetical protein
MPHDAAERDTYFALDDFGGLLVAHGTRLTRKRADRATLIRDLLDLQSLWRANARAAAPYKAASVGNRPVPVPLI